MAKQRGIAAPVFAHQADALVGKHLQIYIVDDNQYLCLNENHYHSQPGNHEHFK
jgi:hypothetical protein